MEDDSRTVRLPALQYRKLVFLSVGTNKPLSCLLAEAVDMLTNSKPHLRDEIAVELSSVLERTAVNAKSSRKRNGARTR